MTKTNLKIEKRERRHKKIRTKIFGTKEKPRLSVFKSNKYLYVQLIDDENKNTLAAYSSKGLKGAKKSDAKETGKAVAKIAKEKKINKVVFDRGGFLFKGKVQLLAEGAREGGLKF